MKPLTDLYYRAMLRGLDRAKQEQHTAMLYGDSYDIKRATNKVLFYLVAVIEDSREI